MDLDLKKPLYIKFIDFGPPAGLLLLLLLVWLVVAIVYVASRNKANLNLILPMMMIPPCLTVGCVAFVCYAGYFFANSPSDGPLFFLSDLCQVTLILALLILLANAGSWIIFFISLRRIVAQFPKVEPNG